VLGIVTNGVRVDDRIHRRRIVVMEARLICRGSNDGNPFVVGMIDSPPGIGAVIKTPERLLDNLRPLLRGIKHCMGKSVGINHKTIVNPQEHDTAASADSRLTYAIVKTCGRIQRFSIAMPET